MDTHKQLLAWALGSDTGLSSKHMAAIAAGLPGTGDYPRDAGDLGRCIRLVDAVPQVRESFTALAESSEKWALTVKHWDEWVRIYKTEKSRPFHYAPRTRQAMRDAGI